MPLLMVCLEVTSKNSPKKKKNIHLYQSLKIPFQGLGKLAEKFPSIAGTSISYLRDFLVDPSPILTKLHLQAIAQQKKEKEMQPYKIVGE